MKRVIALTATVVLLGIPASLASERNDGAKAVYQAGKPFVAHGNLF